MMKTLLLSTTSMLMLGFLAACDNSCTSGPNENRIQVQGNCLDKVKPDRAQINVTINVLKPTSQEASTQAQETYQKLVEMSKELGLKELELETSSYTVTEDYQWGGDNKGQVFKGYRAQMGLNISTADINRIGEVIQKSASLPNANAGGFNMYISPKRYKEAREDCLAIAVKNAKDKAEKMAEAGGAKVGKLMSVNETSRDYAPPMPYARMEMAMMSKAADEAAPAPSIESKSEDLSVTIDAAFEIR